MSEVKDDPHNQGNLGWIYYLKERFNQIGKKYFGDESIRKGIGVTLKTRDELREQYVNDNQAPTIPKSEERESVLDILR